MRACSSCAEGAHAHGLGLLQCQMLLDCMASAGCGRHDAKAMFAMLRAVRGLQDKPKSSASADMCTRNR